MMPRVTINHAAVSESKSSTSAYMTNMGRSSAAPDMSICILVSRPELVSLRLR